MKHFTLLYRKIFTMHLQVSDSEKASQIRKKLNFKKYACMIAPRLQHSKTKHYL